MEDPSPSTSSPLHQPSQFQNTSVAWQSDGSIDADHSPKNAPSHRGAQPHAAGGSFKDNFSPSPTPPLINVVMAANNPVSHDGLPDSEFEECDSVTTRSTSKPVPTNSAQFMHLRNSGETSLPTSSHKSYLETSAFAATLVESVYEVDTTAAPASSKSIEQRLAVSSSSSSPDVSALQEVQQQDPGYLGSNQFASSSILHRHAGDMDPHGGIPMDSSQTEHDSEGIQIYTVA